MGGFGPPRNFGRVDEEKCEGFFRKGVVVWKMKGLCFVDFLFVVVEASLVGVLLNSE